jgi:hypothetical protein
VQYTSWDAEALRNWRLEGSNDGHNWVILRTHTDDPALNGKGSTATWPIERPETKGAFSLFRLYQTGVNSNAHHYLACSGWEMYGKLYSPQNAGAGAGAAAAGQLQAVGQAQQSVVTCAYQSDFDTNGVFYHIGSAGKTQPWKNPGEVGAVQCYCSELATDPPSQPAYAIVGRETVRCVSAAKPNMWFMIDMKHRRVNPTHYTLRYALLAHFFLLLGFFIQPQPHTHLCYSYSTCGLFVACAVQALPELGRRGAPVLAFGGVERRLQLGSAAQSRQ